MDNIQQHIDSLLNTGNYSLSDSEVKAIDTVGLDSWILSRLLSKKFRKTKAVPECIERTKRAIYLNTAQNKPLRVIYPQGGYKLWRFPSSPKADWAEYFNISYVLEYLAPIAAAYKPGVKLTYYMHTLLMEKHDNLTTKEIDAYVKSFQSLLDKFQMHLPENIQLSILRDADMYQRDEYFEALEAGTSEARKQFQDFPKEKQDRYIRMAKLNIKWDGAERWDLLSPSEKDQKLVQAAIYEVSATSNLPKVAKQVKSDDTILLFTTATPQFIGIGSTKTSVAKYWVGFGILEENNKGKYRQRVLSPSQFKKYKSHPHKKIDLKNNLGKNFQEIWIFPSKAKQ